MIRITKFIHGPETRARPPWSAAGAFLKTRRASRPMATIDELNSIVGLARVFNEERLSEGDAHRFLDSVLRQIQDELFDLGSELATPPDFFKKGCIASASAR